MALKDIIDGAREEAKANVAPAPKKDAEVADADTKSKASGFSKRSAANAKPAREAASSVRLETSRRTADPLANETKEEKKARKARERAEEDLRTRAFDIVMKSQPGYKEVDRFFWALLIAGMVLAVLSLIVPWAAGVDTSLSTVPGIISIASLALAYVCIVWAFVYDIRKRRPFRREAEARVRNLSDRKVKELVAAADSERLAAEAEKDAKKAAKTAKK